jgi:hypothetical protein
VSQELSVFGLAGKKIRPAEAAGKMRTVTRSNGLVQSIDFDFATGDCG